MSFIVKDLNGNDMKVNTNEYRVCVNHLSEPRTDDPSKGHAHNTSWFHDSDIHVTHSDGSQGWSSKRPKNE